MIYKSRFRVNIRTKSGQEIEAGAIELGSDTYNGVTDAQAATAARKLLSYDSAAQMFTWGSEMVLREDFSGLSVQLLSTWTEAA